MSGKTARTNKSCMMGSQKIYFPEFFNSNFHLFYLHGKPFTQKNFVPHFHSFSIQNYIPLFLYFSVLSPDLAIHGRIFVCNSVSPFYLTKKLSCFSTNQHSTFWTGQVLVQTFSIAVLILVCTSLHL